MYCVSEVDDAVATLRLHFYLHVFLLSCSWFKSNYVFILSCLVLVVELSEAPSHGIILNLATSAKRLSLAASVILFNVTSYHTYVNVV
jgi:hypothetical protein